MAADVAQRQTDSLSRAAACFGVCWGRAGCALGAARGCVSTDTRGMAHMCTLDAAALWRQRAAHPARLQRGAAHAARRVRPVAQLPLGRAGVCSAPRPGGSFARCAAALPGAESRAASAWHSPGRAPPCYLRSRSLGRPPTLFADSVQPYGTGVQALAQGASSWLCAPTTSRVRLLPPACPPRRSSSRRGCTGRRQIDAAGRRQWWAHLARRQRRQRRQRRLRLTRGANGRCALIPQLAYQRRPGDDRRNACCVVAHPHLHRRAALHPLALHVPVVRRGRPPGRREGACSQPYRYPTQASHSPWLPRRSRTARASRCAGTSSSSTRPRRCRCVWRVRCYGARCAEVCRAVAAA